MKTLKTALFACMAVMAFPINVLGGSQDVCTQYANKALDQLKQASQLGLSGLNPPAWSGDYALHFGWCLTASDQDIRNGEALRQNVIDEYKNIPSAPSKPPFGQKSPKMETVQTGIVAPGAGIGKTVPAPQMVASAKVIPRFPDHCYDGPGHCLWVIPNAKFESIIREENLLYDITYKAFEHYREETEVKIQFPSNKEQISYVCAFVALGKQPDQIDVKHTRPDSNMRADANVGMMPDTVSSTGSCEFRATDFVRDYDWLGFVVILSREPMFVSAHSVARSYGNPFGYDRGYAGQGKFNINDPFAKTLQYSFLGGDTESAMASYAIDCRKPSGYEGVCGYAAKLLNKISAQ